MQSEELAIEIDKKYERWTNQEIKDQPISTTVERLGIIAVLIDEAVEPLIKLLAEVVTDYGHTVTKEQHKSVMVRVDEIFTAWRRDNPAECGGSEEKK